MQVTYSAPAPLPWPGEPGIHAAGSRRARRSALALTLGLRIALRLSSHCIVVPVADLCCFHPCLSLSKVGGHRKSKGHHKEKHRAHLASAHLYSSLLLCPENGASCGAELDSQFSLVLA